MKMTKVGIFLLIYWTLIGIGFFLLGVLLAVSTIIKALCLLGLVLSGYKIYQTASKDRYIVTFQQMIKEEEKEKEKKENER